MERTAIRENKMNFILRERDVNRGNELPIFQYGFLRKPISIMFEIKFTSY